MRQRRPSGSISKSCWRPARRLRPTGPTVHQVGRSEPRMAQDGVTRAFPCSMVRVPGLPPARPPTRLARSTLLLQAFPPISLLPQCPSLEMRAPPISKAASVADLTTDEMIPALVAPRALNAAIQWAVLVVVLAEVREAVAEEVADSEVLVASAEVREAVSADVSMSTSLMDPSTTLREVRLLTPRLIRSRVNRRPTPVIFNNASVCH